MHSRQIRLLPFDRALQIDPDDGSHREISASEPIWRVLILRMELLQEKPMTESQKLSALRDKLIHRRRALVEGIEASINGQLNGDDIVRVQNEIEAVERAMAEEKRAEFRL
jgi:hypothetical protein